MHYVDDVVVGDEDGNDARHDDGNDCGNANYKITLGMALVIIHIAVLAEAPVGMRLLDADPSAVPPPTRAVLAATAPTPDPPLRLQAPGVVAVAPLFAPQRSPPSPASWFALPSSA